jgi:uncharacterized repeat protein (TIGR02543 family)/LPXTG-motif cell wall-anchored protein
VKINSVDKSSVAQVVNDGSGYLRISFTSAQTAGPLEVSFNAGAFGATSAGSYNFELAARDSGMANIGTYTEAVTVAGANATVTFDGNGADGGSTASQTTNTGTALTLNGFTKTGYTFGGWANSQTNANAGTVYKADGAVYSFQMSTTLYAIWNASGSGGASTPAAADNSLASTGFDGAPYLASGVLLALVGAALLLIARRRKTI